MTITSDDELEVTQAEKCLSVTISYKGAVKEAVDLGVNSGSSGPLSLTVYPNPITDRFVMDFDNPVDQTATISLFDLQGKLIFSNDLGLLKKGHNSEVVELPGSLDGVYLLQLLAPEMKEVKTLSFVR